MTNNNLEDDITDGVFLYDGLPVPTGILETVIHLAKSRLDGLPPGVHDAPNIVGQDAWKCWTREAQVHAERSLRHAVIFGTLPLYFLRIDGVDRFGLKTVEQCQRTLEAVPRRSYEERSRPEHIPGVSIQLVKGTSTSSCDTPQYVSSGGRGDPQPSFLLRKLAQVLARIKDGRIWRQVVDSVFNETRGSSKGLELVREWRLRVDPHADASELEMSWTPGDPNMGIWHLLWLADEGDGTVAVTR